MTEQPSLIKNVLKKGIIGLVVGGVLVGAARALEFPPVFQVMFFLYAVLGAAVFILLDAPPVKPLGGIKAVLALILFYGVLSAAYIGGASRSEEHTSELQSPC